MKLKYLKQALAQISLRQAKGQVSNNETEILKVALSPWNKTENVSEENQAET